MVGIAQAILFQQAEPVCPGCHQLRGVVAIVFRKTQGPGLEPEVLEARGPAALAQRVDTGEAGRWRKFTREQLKARSDKLDVSWLKDENVETADAQRDEPAFVARMVMRELNGAMAELRSLLEELGEDPDAALEDLLVDDTTADEAQP
jgi:hypothetical protein